MAPERAPAFQFYPKDFLMDGNVQAMSLQERGAYITLLCVCWQEQSLPNDAKRLANMVGVQLKAFLKLWPAVRVCFTEQGERLIHGRLEKERQKQDVFRRRQSDAGRASAANRAATTRQPTGNHGSTTGQPRPQPEANSPISDLRSKNLKKELRPPKEPAGRAREFLSWFIEEYKTRRHGAEYLVKWERDTPLVNAMLKAATFERLQKFAQVMLSDKCDERFIVETDRGIGILSTKFNWLSDRLAAWEARSGSA